MSRRLFRIVEIFKIKRSRKLTKNEGIREPEADFQIFKIFKFFLKEKLEKFDKLKILDFLVDQDFLKFEEFEKY